MSVCASVKQFQLPQIFEKEINQRSYNRFLIRLCEEKNIKHAVFTFPFSCNDPLRYLEVLDPGNEFLFYQEKPENGCAIAAGGALIKISESGSDRFLKTQRAIEAAEKKNAAL